MSTVPGHGPGSAGAVAEHADPVREGDRTAPRVTVVIPVYNPGPYIDACIDSMLAQSLPPDELELLFVDDGSGGNDAARLDALAARHPHVRVIHLPHSGSPGRPRNVGIAAASGEYVQFLDADDTMAPDALERLHAAGRRNAADIVMGKLASDFRSVAHGLFRRGREACTIRDAPLIDSVGPVKMYRAAFLREHGLAFPEEPRWLEDQPFVVRAYLAARTVSILADQVYYYHRRRDDGANLGSTQIEPWAYSSHLRDVLEVIVAGTEPGPFRAGLLRRFLRVEMLGHLGEATFPGQDPDRQGAIVAAFRQLATDLMGPEVDEGLGAVLRLRASLMRQGRTEDLVTLAERCAPIRATTHVEAITWRRGRLALDFTVRLETGDGRPVPLARREGRLLLDPGLTDGIAAPLDGAQPDALAVQVFLRDDPTGTEWVVPTQVRAGPGPGEDGDEGEAPSLSAAASASVDSLRVAGGTALPAGTWELWVRLTGFGLDRRTRIGSGEPPGDGPPAALLGSRPHVVVVERDHGAGIVLRIDGPGPAPGAGFDPQAVIFGPTDGRQLSAQLPIVTGEGATPWEGSIVLRDPAGDQLVRAKLVPARGTLFLRAQIPRSPRIAAGPYRLLVRLGVAGVADLPVGEAEVTRPGRLYPAGARRLGPLGGALRRVGRGARALIRRLPPRWRSVLRATAGGVPGRPRRTGDVDPPARPGTRT